MRIDLDKDIDSCKYLEKLDEDLIWEAYQDIAAQTLASTNA